MEFVGILGPVFATSAKGGDSQIPRSSFCNDTDMPVIRLSQFFKMLSYTIIPFLVHTIKLSY